VLVQAGVLLLVVVTGVAVCAILLQRPYCEQQQEVSLHAGSNITCSLCGSVRMWALVNAIWVVLGAVAVVAACARHQISS
jgi:hypothetical protein